MSPDFSQYFTLYTFASDHSYDVVLTQKNTENNEVPIAFMSSSFKGTELNYPVVYQQAYGVFKVVKSFSTLSFEIKDESYCPSSSRQEPVSAEGTR
jgi:hypothetical protein